MSEGNGTPGDLAARLLALGLLVALPLFAGHLSIWEPMAVALTVGLCVLLASVGRLCARGAVAGRGQVADLFLAGFLVWLLVAVRLSGTSGPAAVVLIVVLCVLLAVAGRLCVRGGLLDRGQVADLFLAGFLGLLALATFSSVYLHGSLVQILQVGSYLALMWLCASLFRDEPWRRRGWLAIACGGALTGLLGLREYAHTAILQGARSWRVFGTFYNPNCLAGYLLAAMPAALVLLAAAWSSLRPTDDRERPRYGVIFAGFALLLPAAALLLTASRAGVLGALLGAAVFLALRPSRVRKRWLALAGLALILLALGAPPLRKRFVEVTSQSHSAVFRWYTWRGTVKMIEARPLLGFGPGSFEFAYQQFAEAGFTRMAHQTPLQLAAEAGVPALAAVLVALGLIGRDLLVAGRAHGQPGVEAAAGLAALAALGLQNLFDYTWYVTAVGATLAAVVGLARAAPRGEPAALAPRPRGARARVWVAVGASLLMMVAGGWGLRAQWLASRGRAFLAQNRPAMGYGWLNQAARVDPLDAAIFEDLATAALRSATSASYGLQQAVQARLRAIRLCPLKAGNYVVLAQLYQALGDGDLALTTARRGVELGRNHPHAYAVLAQLLEQAGDHPAALETYRRMEAVYHSPVGRYQAVEQVTDYAYAYAWMALGREAMGAGEPERAAQYFHRAYDLTHEYARVQRNMEQALRLLGTWDEAEVAEAERIAQQADLAAQEAEARLKGQR